MAKTVAMIMAAGSGERFAGKGPKILVPLLGLPALVWSARRFARHSAVHEIVVVAPPGEEERIRSTLGEHRVGKIARVAAGGATRQESVRLGLETLDPDCALILIHDAARPCLGADLVDRVIETLASDGAVIPVLPAVDTLVRESNGAVDALLDRVHISGVQTPQGFHAALILRAHRSAKARGFASSDDGSLVFALGEKVRTIEGERSNIKITYPEDAAVAEAILRASAAGEEA
jgi:2-C-methyl-D-erythritol 4-phosphate cytidylyltransferase